MGNILQHLSNVGPLTNPSTLTPLGVEVFFSPSPPPTFFLRNNSSRMESINVAGSLEKCRGCCCCGGGGWWVRRWYCDNVWFNVRSDRVPSTLCREPPGTWKTTANGLEEAH